MIDELSIEYVGGATVDFVVEMVSESFRVRPVGASEHGAHNTI